MKTIAKALAAIAFLGTTCAAQAQVTYPETLGMVTRNAKPYHGAPERCAKLIQPHIDSTPLPYAGFNLVIKLMDKFCFTPNPGAGIRGYY